jgi:hypothetical protein
MCRSRFRRLPSPRHEPRRTRRPKSERLPVRLVRFSGPTFTFGIERHVVERVAVKVYSPAKTVADCFKFRYKIGVDVALEALRACWKQRRATMNELYEAACVCRGHAPVPGVGSVKKDMTCRYGPRGQAQVA